MIQTEQTVTIDANIDRVWSYASDIQKWAAIMPGYRECEIIDADHSRWTLKVGVGGLVRTVKVAVHVTRWAGPEAVDFTFELEGDPVKGGGNYRATRKSATQTDLTLTVQVIGSGAMAPMWEAMGGPLLPKFAKGFAEQLKEAIEAQAGAAPVPAVAPKGNALMRWLCGLWRALFGKK